MASQPVYYDGVWDTSTTTSTGTYTLSGTAPLGYQNFSVVGDGNSCWYRAYDLTNGGWENGIGTYTASGTTFSRDTILSSSNSGNAVSWSAGTRQIILVQPAERLPVVLPLTNGYRLSLTSLTPRPTADKTGASTLYLTPDTGSHISIYDTGTQSWLDKTPGETSLSLSGLTSGAVYDVFAYIASGTFKIDLFKWRNSGAAVTGAVTSGGLIKLTVTGHGLTTGDTVFVNGVLGTTEANGIWLITTVDANTFTLNGSTFTNAYTSGGWMGARVGGTVVNQGLGRQDFILVNPAQITSVINSDTIGANAGRYVGTLKTTATTTTEMSQANQYVWNAYNQILRTVYGAQSTSTINLTQSFATCTGANENFVLGWASEVDYRAQFDFDASVNTTTAAGDLFEGQRNMDGGALVVNAALATFANGAANLGRATPTSSSSIYLPPGAHNPLLQAKNNTEAKGVVRATHTALTVTFLG